MCTVYVHIYNYFLGYKEHFFVFCFFFFSFLRTEAFRYCAYTRMAQFVYNYPRCSSWIYNGFHPDQWLIPQVSCKNYSVNLKHLSKKRRKKKKKCTVEIPSQPSACINLFLSIIIISALYSFGSPQNTIHYYFFHLDFTEMNQPPLVLIYTNKKNLWITSPYCTVRCERAKASISFDFFLLKDKYRAASNTEIVNT